MNATGIEWTEFSWNPVTGCSPVSEGCRNCYARRMANRLRGRYGYPKDEPFRVTFHADRLTEPLRKYKPRRIFVCSMGDLFHENVPNRVISKIFVMMAMNLRHEFYLLTKRPPRMEDYLRYIDEFRVAQGQDRCQCFVHAPLPNVHLGISASNQGDLDRFGPPLMKLAAAGWRTFVSLEPLLGPIDLPVDLTPWLSRSTFRGPSSTQWVIVGGETGPRARPMNPDWVRAVRDQCAVARVPFFFKQWGEYVPDDHFAATPEVQRWLNNEGAGSCLTEAPGFTQIEIWPNDSCSFRVGRKAAGRTLDGRTHDEVPWTTAIRFTAEAQRTQRETE